MRLLYCCPVTVLQLLVTAALKALYQEAISFGSGWNMERGVKTQQQQQQQQPPATAAAAAAAAAPQSAQSAGAARAEVPGAAPGGIRDTVAAAAGGGNGGGNAGNSEATAAAAAAPDGGADGKDSFEVPSLYVLSAGVAISTWDSNQLMHAGIPEQVLEHIYSLAGKVGAVYMQPLTVQGYKPSCS